MSPIVVILTIAAYCTVLFTVAWLSSRGVTAEKFFTAGRSTPRIVAAIAMVGAAMSGVTYISVPGTVAADSFSYLQTTLGFVIGYVVIAYLLIPLYYRLGVVSLYEYLERRFGESEHRTGAWLFFISKIMSASLRAYVVCEVLQSLLYDKLGLPFAINALAMMLFVWLYTRRGGVRAVVWVEMLKSLLMSLSVVMCIIFVIRALELSSFEALREIYKSDYSDVLFLDNPLDRRYFFKQVVAGAFLVIAMTGLDQDMMQTMLTCRTQRDAQRGMLSSIAIQSVVILLFLLLGALLYIFIDSRGLTIARGDDLFGYVATECGLPTTIGILFLTGLIASTFSSAGSALTALTTSFSLDILGAKRENASLRKRVHLAIALAITLLIIAFERWSTSGAITLIFTLASYTYGPLLGLFAFGLFTQRMPRRGAVLLMSALSPTLSYLLANSSEQLLRGYTFSYEIIIVNATIMFLGLYALSRRRATT